MKRLLVVFTLALLLPLSAFAQSDRTILLTNDGTLYTVESFDPQNVDNLQTTSTRVLMMTVQNGANAAMFPVPASLSGGGHSDPALAYDSDSQTLFVFWEAARNGGLASDLMFCSYHSGQWSAATKLDSIDWDLRENFRIAITRRTQQIDGTLIPEVTVHAVWWQQNNSGYSWARYAMLTVDKGNVSSIQIHDVSEFLSAVAVPAEHAADNQILHHPAVFESTNQDTVDVVFGDIRSDKMHRVTIKPIANGRLRIPVGVRESEVAVPTVELNFVTSVAAMGSAGSDNMAFYFTTGQTLNYTVLRNGSWSPLRTITMNERVTRDAALDALHRMLNAD
jgi:hypothetical protein